VATAGEVGRRVEPCPGVPVPNSDRHENEHPDGALV
jgi:hypothetical protein